MYIIPMHIFILLLHIYVTINSIVLQLLKLDLNMHLSSYDLPFKHNMVWINVTLIYLFLLQYNISLSKYYHKLFIWSSTDGLLCCFQCFAIAMQQ